MSAQPKPHSEDEAKARFDRIKKQGQPTDNHRKLAQLVGDWDVTTTSYSGPNAEPVVSKGGRSSVKPAYDGRFFAWTTDETYLGEAVQTMGTLGYNNRTMRLFYTRYPSWGTNFMVAEGPVIPDHPEFSLQATEHLDSFTGSRDTPGARVAIKVISPTKHVLQFFETDELNTKEYLASESVFTKKV